MSTVLRRLLFNFWYFREPPWDTGISPVELMEFIQSHPPGRALDLGCGTGTNVITLAQHGWQVTGVDFAWRAIRIARQKAQRAKLKVDLLIEDVTRVRDVDGRFDLVLDMGCYHSLPLESREAYLENLGRLLAPEGSYLMYGFFKNPRESGPGLTEADLQMLNDRFMLLARKDGSERGLRPSAWFTYRRL
jgi:SAM-dependent methyltransferase